MERTSIYAHPILTGSIFPIRSKTAPIVCDLSGGIYRLISDSALPSGLFARLVMMTAVTRMIENDSTTVTWKTTNRLLSDMMVAPSGSSVTLVRTCIQRFSAVAISTPRGEVHLTPIFSGRSISLTADTKLLDMIESDGIRAEDRIIQLLRGKGLAGMPTDLYLWLASLRTTTMDHLFPWAELKTMSALIDNKNFPLYFVKSLYVVTSVYHEVEAFPLNNGIQVRTGKRRKSRR